LRIVALSPWAATVSTITVSPSTDLTVPVTTISV
jgi:hypothetical protein